MANIGEIAEIINASELTLNLGTGYLVTLSQLSAVSGNWNGATANMLMTFVGDTSGATTTVNISSSFDGTLNSNDDFEPYSFGGQTGVFTDGERISVLDPNGVDRFTTTYNDNYDGRYILLNDLSLHIGRTEHRKATTDAGALYTFGKGMSWFIATLAGATSQIDALTNFIKINTAGDMTIMPFEIVANDVSGNPKTFTVLGYVAYHDISKPEEGIVKGTIMVRIKEDTITIS